MTCNCKKDLEEKMATRFAGIAPEASGHSVELQGYGFAMVGNTLLHMPFMLAHAKATYPLKKGGTKEKVVKQTLAFSFCPFCGASTKPATGAAA